MRRRFWKSITWRIQSWYALALVLAITGMMVAVQKYERANRLDDVDAQLAKLMRPLFPEVDPLKRSRGGPGGRDPEGPPPAADRPGAAGKSSHPPRPAAGESRSLPHDILVHSKPVVDSWIAGSYWAVAWNRHGTEVLKRGAQTPADLSYRGGAIAEEYFTREGHRRMRARGPAASTIVVGVPLAAFDESLRQYAWNLAGFGSLLFGIGFSTGWLILRWGLRPLREIGKTATEIARGDLSRRIDVADAGSELRDLAGVLNDAFARLEANLQQRERFTADASHELRTPLAVVLGQIQQLLGKQGRASEDREGLANAERAARRMKKLVDELMVLARLDGAGEPHREPLDLADLGREVASEMRGLLARRDATIALDLQPAPVSGNRDALVRVITNLIGNAAQHNPIGVSITVKTGTGDQGAFAVVEDNGHGIGPEHRGRLFERFYRVDASRANHSGGGNSGLGLAISDAIVRQHGGTIEVASEPGKGSRFTIHLPNGQSRARLVASGRAA